MGLARLGVDDETAELVLGHVPQGVRKVYDLHDRLDERRAALTHWAEFVVAASRRAGSGLLWGRIPPSVGRKKIDTFRDGRQSR